MITDPYSRDSNQLKSSGNNLFKMKENELIETNDMR